MSQAPVQSIVRLGMEPHPDYYDALDKLVPFVCEVLDLGKIWEVISSIGALKLDWSYSNVSEKFTYKIDSVTITRPSEVGELPLPRVISVGGIVFDDIPIIVQQQIELIMDEAWLYCQGMKMAQSSLFLRDLRNMVRRADPKARSARRLQIQKFKLLRRV